jgi:hypothetical protein
MNRRGRILVGGLGAVGLVVAAAVATLFQSSSDPAAALVDVVGNDYFLVAGVAVLSLAVVAVVVGLRGVDGIDQTTPPEPETVQHAVHPGAEFDRTVEQTSFVPFVGDTERRGAVRGRLRDAAVRSVMRTDDVSRERAVERVESGAWTDDDVAATFLSESDRTSLTGRLLGVLTAGSGYRRGARRASDEICRREGVEGGET